MDLFTLVSINCQFSFTLLIYCEIYPLIFFASDAFIDPLKILIGGKSFFFNYVQCYYILPQLKSFNFIGIF